MLIGTFDKQKKTTARHCILFLGVQFVCCVFFLEINKRITDWKSYLMQKLVGASTIPVDFHALVTLNAHWVTYIPVAVFVYKQYRALYVFLFCLRWQIV